MAVLDGAVILGSYIVEILNIFCIDRYRAVFHGFPVSGGNAADIPASIRIQLHLAIRNRAVVFLYSTVDNAKTRSGGL